MKKDKTNIAVDMILVNMTGGFLLDDKNNIKKFYTVKSAKLHLKRKGITNFNGIDFVKESEIAK